MTALEARDQGYYVYDSTWQRGYVSRKKGLQDFPVQTAGGNRKGDLFYLAPTEKSTQYCVRNYIKKG